MMMICFVSDVMKKRLDDANAKWVLKKRTLQSVGWEERALRTTTKKKNAEGKSV